MRDDNLLAVRRRKFVVTTDSHHRFQVHPNLAESLELSAVNQLWVADITYIRLRGEFVFLAVVLDAYSRKVIGWELGRTLETRLPLAALEAAIAGRRPAWVGASLRSRNAVCEQRLREAAGELRCALEHEPARPSVGKRQV